MRLTAMLIVSAALVSGPVFSLEPDTREARLAAVNEYFSYVPLEKMMQDMAVEVAKQVPEQRRQQFIDTLTKNFRVNVVEAAARESLATHLTLQELTVFVDFMRKPEARSAMDKMKFYLADLMPVLQQELTRAVKITNEQK